MPTSLLRDRVQRDFTILGLVSRVEGFGASTPPRGGGHPGRARGGVDVAWRGQDHTTAPPVPVAIRLSGFSDVDVTGADLDVPSGLSAGARIRLLAVNGDLAVFGPGNTEAIAQGRSGDAVRIDNSGCLAAETYHRHQVPEPGQYAVWDQFRRSDGSPRYPQRPVLLGPLFASAAAGTVQTGRFEGKMIVVEALLDREALTWHADWCAPGCARTWATRSTSISACGSRITPSMATMRRRRTRLTRPAISACSIRHCVISAAGSRRGSAPTVHEVRRGGGTATVPSNASERRGIQPVVSLSVNDDERAEVVREGSLSFRVEAEVPDGAGVIVAVAWDPAGSGTFSVQEAATAAPPVVLERHFTFSNFGTFFPTVRVVAQRDGDGTSPFAPLQNLARVRVVERGM